MSCQKHEVDNLLNLNLTKYQVQNSTFGLMVYWFFGPLVIFIYLFGPLDSVYCTSLIVTSKQYHFDFLGLSKAIRLGSFYIKMKNCFTHCASLVFKCTI